MTHGTVYDSPLGPLTLRGDGTALQGIWFPGPDAPAGAPGRPERLAGAVAQLEEYFAGERTAFDLALDLRGSAFEREVWAALRTIAYGETISYGALAATIRPERVRTELEQVAHVRAVAAAVGRTPTPIVVPCHRVVGADGSLTGYGGGLRRKRALLDFEASRGDPDVLAEVWVREQLALL